MGGNPPEFILFCQSASLVFPDGNCSEDAASDGGEFLDDNVEFRRPSSEILLKSIPIVHSQQVFISEFLLITLCHDRFSSTLSEQ